MLQELAKIELKNRAALEESFALYGFLPAPKTWIEWDAKQYGERVAVMLEERDEEQVDATMFWKNAAQPLGILRPKTCDIETPGGMYCFPETMVSYCVKHGMDAGQFALATMQAAHGILVLINSPKIIGRRQYMPNLSFERRLTKQLGVGKFPLHAWTELKLSVAKPPEIDDGEPHEAHLTGKRALHFCRKHLRIRLGKLEYVSAHWRGDPALGIKQKRYRLTA